MFGSAMAMFGGSSNQQQQQQGGFKQQAMQYGMQAAGNKYGGGYQVPGQQQSYAQSYGGGGGFGGSGREDEYAQLMNEMRSLLERAGPANSKEKKALADQIKDIIRRIGGLGTVDGEVAREKLERVGINEQMRLQMKRDWEILQKSTKSKMCAVVLCLPSKDTSMVIPEVAEIETQADDTRGFSATCNEAYLKVKQLFDSYEKLKDEQVQDTPQAKERMGAWKSAQEHCAEACKKDLYKDNTDALCFKQDDSWITGVNTANTHPGV